MVEEYTEMTKIIQHRITKQTKELTQEEYDRFFDNNSPFDWLIIKDN